MKQQRSPNKGFTLIELLITIALIAILALVAILYLNPGQLLRQARDSSRLTDLASLKDGIALYLSDVPTPSIGTQTVCYIGNSVGTSTANCALYFQTATSTATSTSRSLDGTGWVPINFTKVSSGLPLDNLPIDPTGPTNANYFYSYTPGAKSTFKLAGKMESQLYGQGGDKDSVSGDGGLSASTYELGSDLTL